MEYESCDFDSASLILSFCQPHFGSPERLLPTRSLGSCQSSGEPSEEGAPQVRMDWGAPNASKKGNELFEETLQILADEL